MPIAKRYIRSPISSAACRRLFNHSLAGNGIQQAKCHRHKDPRALIGAERQYLLNLEQAGPPHFALQRLLMEEEPNLEEEEEEGKLQAQE